MPGTAVFQRTFWPAFTSQSAGRFCPSATPRAKAPRKEGHSWAGAVCVEERERASAWVSAVANEPRRTDIGELLGGKGTLEVFYEMWSDASPPEII